jgi:DNA polymerase-3 subunit gamma/tau
MEAENAVSVALYRKWRPQTLAEVAGQEHITRTLENALAKGKTSHAYLFAGPRGTGKTSTARILAKALNCVTGPGPQPCNECPVCVAITAGASLDVLEIDAASRRGIDEMRELRERVKLAPAAARCKVYIIDEAHMLTTEAANALLKTLEEPPATVVFILATTEPHKMPATILSRCQRFDFRRLNPAVIRARLEQVLAEIPAEATPEALDLIARAAEGSLRDALGILDQVTSLGQDQVCEETVADLLGKVRLGALSEMLELIDRGDTAGALRLIQEVDAGGKDIAFFIRDLLTVIREDLLQGIARNQPAPASMVRCLEEFSKALEDTKTAAIRTLPLELAVIRMLSGQPGPAAGDEDPALRKVQAVWPDILRAVKEVRPVTFGYLSRARPVAVAGKSLKVALEDSFGREALARQGHREVVEQVLARFLGGEWRLEEAD